MLFLGLFLHVLLQLLQMLKEQNTCTNHAISRCHPMEINNSNSWNYEQRSPTEEKTIALHCRYYCSLCPWNILYFGLLAQQEGD
jgi:hypothetical protein